MADPWVTKVQNWLNTTYSGVLGFRPVAVTGRTGWSTMYALTRALQHELGITELSDSFGPGTLGRLSNLGPIGPTTSQKNIVRLIQGAMYCKGYDGGNGELDGVYSATTIAGVKELRQDIGLAAGDGRIAAKITKALFNMDAFVLIDGGSAAIRTIQRDLNNRYLGRADFFAIPADGYFSRAVQNALMLAIQYEIGMADGVANGNFGPGTQAGLRSQGLIQSGSADGSRYFVHLFQAALTFNGYTTAYNGSFTATTANTTGSFQAFAMLPATRQADFQTWASLLVSTGDPERPGAALDCSADTVTPARAATLVANGYETVGRYLTNTPNIADPLDKNIKPGELETIFGAGMTVFPIFQEGADGVEFFDYPQGQRAAIRADAAARGYGFKPGTVIYFAADFDAIEEEIFDNVIPFFRAINDAFRTIRSSYRVGIYGARNSCTKVSERDLAVFSFVSGMSTGYSGNLGFPLPENWAFDQVKEFTLGSGAGAIHMDKDIKSGRDRGQSSVLDDPPTLPAPDKDPNRDFFAFLSWLQGAAIRWFADHPNGYSVPRLVAEYMRIGTYDGTLWQLSCGDLTPGYFQWVEEQRIAAVVSREMHYYEPTDGRLVHSPHMFATLSGYLAHDIPSTLDDPAFVDLGGWAGDLITVLNNYIDVPEAQRPPMLKFGKQNIGAAPRSDRNFDREDFDQDIDGYNLALACFRDPETSLVDHIVDVFRLNGTAPSRYERFWQGRFGGSEMNALSAARRPFTNVADTPQRLMFNGGRYYFLNSSSPLAADVLLESHPTSSDLGTAFILRLQEKMANPES